MAAVLLRVDLLGRTRSSSPRVGHSFNPMENRQARKATSETQIEDLWLIMSGNIKRC